MQPALVGKARLRAGTALAAGLGRQGRRCSSRATSPKPEARLLHCLLTCEECKIKHGLSEKGGSQPSAS
ncbi:OCIA domain-containing protein 2 [Tupaia chinensis]|uniref:OCIA domain-containing protein 2 n=1 Tax=Tupaia chinensis TaxID=246437 RepID=L9L9S0_TUPCH|nr:OCIA domain-containing protein 2 [Tupaia chinensis]